MKKCPFCAEEIQDEAVVCRFCGKDFEIKEKCKHETPKKIGIAGIVAISTAGIALCMPVILMMLLAPIAFIAASVEIAKGKKWIGVVAMSLSLIELVVVLSTFQSCASSLSSISGESYYGNKTALNWKEHLKLAHHSNKSESYSDYEEWNFEVENIGDKIIKEAKFNLTIKDLSGDPMFTKSDKFVYAHQNPIRPGEIKKFDMYIDKIKSKKTSDTFSYSIEILDYE